MLLVKTQAGLSKIHGTGLFAVEFISRGDLVWKFSSTVDKAYTLTEVEKLPEPKRSEVLSLYHPYVSKQTGRYIDYGDDAGYINHSTDPNLGTRYEDGIEEDINFALRDIKVGEELTIDYKTFAEEGTDFELEKP
jgi:uncharacterized protein